MTCTFYKYSIDFMSLHFLRPENQFSFLGNDPFKGYKISKS